MSCEVDSITTISVEVAGTMPFMANQAMTLSTAGKDMTPCVVGEDVT